VAKPGLRQSGELENSKSETNSKFKSSKPAKQGNLSDLIQNSSKGTMSRELGDWFYSERFK
jgi:hypothetical protein